MMNHTEDHKVAPSLKTITVEDFQCRLGEEFSLAYEPGGEMMCTLKLMEATARVNAPSASRQPFSLLFTGAAEPALHQGTYWFSSANFAEEGIFIVPVAGNSQQRTYQAIFA
jgi:hypothetical protein